MRKMLILVVGLLVCFSVPMFAQEDKEKMAEHEEHMMPPPPLSENETCQWLVGEWQGWTEHAEGKSEDWEKIELGLSDQMLIRKSKSQMGDMTYHGLGTLTLNPETGEYIGFWSDNFRGMYQGSGTQEDDTINLSWEGYQGTYSQVITKAGPDSYTFTYSFTDREGNTMEGKGEMKRVKEMMTDKE